MSSQIIIASITLNSYTACVAVAALLGTLWALWRTRRSWEACSATLSGLFIIAAISLVLGRLGYAWLNQDYFRDHPGELFSTASPGYSEHIALFGALLGWGIASRWRRSMEPLALVLLATLLGIGASIGCVPNGCAYGREVFWTDGWPWSLRVDWPDAYTINNPRLPTQVFTVAWLVVCLLVTLASQQVLGQQVLGQHLLGQRYRSGWAMLLTWTGLFACGDFAIQFARADTTVFIAGWRAQQWFDLMLFLAFVVSLVVSRRRDSKRDTLILM